MPPFTCVVVSAEESQNAPSEDNFDETVSIVEARSLSKLAPTLRNQ